MLQYIFSIDDIKSGYVIKLRSGRKFLVIRAGCFTKIIIDPRTGDWAYLSSQFNRDMTRRSDIKPGASEVKIGKEDDIVEVYGLIQGTKNYAYTTSTDTRYRKVIWSRTPPVQMTKEEIESALGYRIEIVGEEDER